MDGIPLPVNIRTLRLVRPRIDIYYPIVYDLVDSTVQQKINSQIFNLVEMLINEQGNYEDQETQITGSYELKTNERGILSFSIIIYTYSGGAHGLTIIKSLTMDIQTGKVYELMDLFQENSDYVERLSEVIKKQIIDRNISLLDEFKSIRPDQDYYIADQALVVYFQQYEITAYAFGLPHFPISIYEVQDIINREGPLEVMVAYF